ncbi:MAG: GWxTD domain-containing protein, partial [Candidatus Kapabacteria bacterium]|nr:GWxTD domain-containing protein [Candidatus Kapabacteria bacterium]
MNRRFLFYTILSLGILQTGMLAGGIPFSYDVVQFRGDSISTVVEVHYMYADHVLKTKREGKTAIKELSIETMVSNSTGPVATKSKIVESQEIRDSLIHEYAGIISFALKPGQYSLQTTISDVNNPALRDVFSSTLVVKQFLSTSPQISDIILASSIQSSTIAERGTQFERNGLLVSPMPSLEYVGTDAQLQTYCELYGLNKSMTDSFDIRYFIYDHIKREVVDMQYRRKRMGNSQTDVFKLPLDAVTSGMYYLRVELSFVNADNGVKDTIRTMKKFYINNPSMPVEDLAAVSEDEKFERSEFKTFTMEQIDKEFAFVQFIASSVELDPYKQLTTLAAKQRFMFRFWLMRDPQPMTPENEKYEDFKKNVSFARKNFKTIPFPEGWNSDRGRVILKYGQPTQIDRRYFNSDRAHPHEIWHYNEVQGGVQFIFVDIKGVENYILVHSTAMNEIHNYN